MHILQTCTKYDYKAHAYADGPIPLPPILRIVLVISLEFQHHKAFEASNRWLLRGKKERCRRRSLSRKKSAEEEKSTQLGSNFNFLEVEYYVLMELGFFFSPNIF